jgi:hypothetical protein
MNPAAVFEERVLFSPNLPESVNQLLQAAVAASHSDKALAERLFKQAQQLDSRCLQTHFALYKFYFYQGRLHEAEREVIAGLEEAAQQGNFPGDYRRLARGQWNMYSNETSLFYLYTLKALAFIKLRLQQDAEARVILSLLQELDPEDRCGGSVIMSLAAALDEEVA